MCMPVLCASDHLPVPLQEISLSSQVQSLKVLGDNVCVGYQSGCSLYHLYIDQPPQSMIIGLGSGNHFRHRSPFICICHKPLQYAVYMYTCVSSGGRYGGSGERWKKID